MANSGGVAGTTRPIETFAQASFDDTRSIWKYTVESRSGSFALQMRKPKTPSQVITRALNYFIGSGTTARSYAVDIDGFLFEAPVAYYAASKKWNFAPGYDKYAAPFLARAITPGCLQCHVSNIRAVSGTQNKFELIPFIENGISCERCHGPGAVHSRTAKASDIVNPVKQAPEQRDSVCEQCHLSGEIRVDHESSSRTFIAGQMLSASTVTFVRANASPQMKVTSHAESLSQSACKRMSGNRLWCGTCHDPHSKPAPAEQVQYYRARCLTCHTPASCKLETIQRSAKGDDCIACHMTKQPTTDAQHVVSTDHSISRTAHRGELQVNKNAPLVRFDGKTSGPRDLGLAYAIVALREQNATYRDRAFDLLTKAIQTNPTDAQVFSYLADLYKGRSNDKEARRLYEISFQLDPSQASAPAVLGAYAMEAGDLEKAIKLWSQALLFNPALPLVRVNLAEALIKKGRKPEAREVLRKALEFYPDFPAARNLLLQTQ